MKFLSFLSPVLNLLKHIGFIYRIIGIGICFMLFSGSFADFRFLMSSNKVEPITIEELMEYDKSEIPRYLKVTDLTLMTTAYVATENEDGDILDASYPVYSNYQLVGKDSSEMQLSNFETHLIIKDKDFDELSMLTMNSVEGKFDNDAFGEVKRLLQTNGVKVSDDAVLIVKEKAPSFNSALIWSLVTFLLGLLILLSFIPSNTLNPEAAKQQAKLQEIMERVKAEQANKEVESSSKKDGDIL